MSYESLVYQKTGAVGMITIDRTVADNAINIRLAAELSDVCTQINHEEETKAVIIAGAGDKAFSVGADRHCCSWGSNEVRFCVGIDRRL